MRVLELRGPTLMSGYLPSPTPGRGLDPEGFFRTGDLGRLDARGNLHILGRADDLIVTGGENVHPQEVEAALAGLPGIEAAAVFALTDPEWGQIVAAAVVASEPLGLEGLREDLRPALAPFKLPRRLLQLADLPRTPSGKVDRRACAALLAPNEKGPG